VDAVGPSVPVGEVGAVGHDAGDGGVLLGGAGSPEGLGVCGVGDGLPEPSVVGVGSGDVGVDDVVVGVGVPVGVGIDVERAGARAARTTDAATGAVRRCFAFGFVLALDLAFVGLAWAEDRPAAQPSGATCTAESARWVDSPATVVPSSSPSPAKRCW
jgi:hypothetical protein